MAPEVSLFGSYRPGKTFLHRLDPRVKFILLIIFSLTVLLFDGLAHILLLSGFIFILTVASRITPVILWKNFKPVIFILALAIIIQALGYGGPALFKIGPVTVSRAGILNGLLLAYKVTFLIIMALIINFTTSPMALTGSLASLLSPLRKVGLPVAEIAFMMGMTLRFIPMLVDEASRIWTAIQARGIRPGQSWRKRLYYLVFMLVPLLAGIFRRSEHIASAMEARNFRVGQPRSQLRPASLGVHDGLAVGITLALVVIFWLISN